LILNFWYFSKFFSNSINNFAQDGIIQGYADGEFKPNNFVTRAELAVIVDRLRYADAQKII